jgi:hypothetical protein
VAAAWYQYIETLCAMSMVPLLVVVVAVRHWASCCGMCPMCRGCQGQQRNQKVTDPLCLWLYLCRCCYLLRMTTEVCASSMSFGASSSSDKGTATNITDQLPFGFAVDPGNPDTWDTYHSNWPSVSLQPPPPTTAPWTSHTAFQYTDTRPQPQPPPHGYRNPKPKTLPTPFIPPPSTHRYKPPKSVIFLTLPSRIDPTSNS